MPSPSTPASLEALRRALLDYYDRAARALPWRDESDPYRILVSEVMLQQTRVETVKEYYGRWLERFPDLESLAEADEDEVLKAWEGLGYYRRARNLHKAAQIVREDGGGVLPSDFDGLKALPGVGDYTAGAVASIAFGQVAPAVDGNVRRVLSRLRDEPDPKAAWLRATATELLDPDRPGDWNQALMDLGATLCRPRGPRCSECPIADWCAAHAAGTVLERPSLRPRGSVPTVHIALGVFHCRGRLLLVKRPPDGLLGGMWAFPEVEVPGDELIGPDTARCLERLRGLARTMGVKAVGEYQPLLRREHRFTHKHAIYLPWTVQVRREAPSPDGVWAEPSEAEALALPVAQRYVLESWIGVKPWIVFPPEPEVFA